MPLEITADNLLMLAAAAQATSQTAAVEEVWPLMQQYADYLVANGLDPVLQLCSDDYEGPSAHNANLAAKSILGIGAFARLCNLTGRACAGPYQRVAAAYAANWTRLAADGRGAASARNYGLAGSWSLKYNLIWDTVLDLRLFSPATVS